MSIIAISGKINNGKDAVGDIIKYLCAGADKANISFQDWDGQSVWGTELNDFHIMSWETKKFADKLKDTVCLWLGCTREQLENRDFKEKELGEEWARYRLDSIYMPETMDSESNEYYEETHYFATKEDAIEYGEHHKEQFTVGEEHRQFGMSSEWTYEIEKEYLTPRRILQIVGTEAGRGLIHPNIWVNSTISEYKPLPKPTLEDAERHSLYSHYACVNCYKPYSGSKRQRMCKECIEDDSIQTYPNWLITDCRFPNEAGAVHSKEGITIRVNRPTHSRFPELWKIFFEQENAVGKIDEQNFLFWLRKYDEGMYDKLTHESETALDNYNDFTYVIDNDGTFEDLIEKVREILVLEKIL